MNPKQKKRLLGILIVMSLISIAIGLILFALKQNINLFYTPTQLGALSNTPKKFLRLGGYVKKGSIYYDASGESVYFIITDRTNEINIYFHGVLPNLFKEGQAVVVTGKLNDNHQLIANQVLAKHDEKYIPTSLSKELNKGDSHATRDR